MSDLFCAVTMVVVVAGEVESAADSAAALAESLLDRRVAGIWSSDAPSALLTADVLAGALGVPVKPRPGLGEVEGREPAVSVVGRMREEFQTIADLHRGETVVVVSHPAAVTAALRALAVDLGAGSDVDLRACAAREVLMDADGLVVKPAASRP